MLRLLIRRSWLLILVTGTLLWAASAFALAITDDMVLLPTVALLGSFLVPVTVIFWFLDHDRERELGVRRLLLAFFVAGVMGLLAAAVLETWLLADRLFPNLWIGLIEEATKAFGIVVFARRLQCDTVHDGVVLGVVVGLGAYLVAALLHAIWDASSNAGVIVAVLASGSEIQRDALADGNLPRPSTLTAQWLYGLVQWAVMVAVALAGTWLLRRRWRRA